MNFSDSDVQEFIIEATDLLDQAEANFFKHRQGRRL